MNARLQLNSRLLPIVVGVLFVLQLAETSRVWTILLVGLGGAWLISFLWARSLARNLRLTREMRFGWAQVGDRLEERFTLTNRGILPCLWAEVTDQSTLPSYRPDLATGMGAESRYQWRTQGLCTRRGMFTLGPTDLVTGDPLGLYTVQLANPAAATLMVMPPVVPLPTIEVAPGGRSGEGRPRTNAPERTVSAAGVREYVAGDSLRLVHWPTTARRDDFYVRLLDGTPAGDWWILLDLDRRVQIGHGWDSTEEHSVILAASLADRGLRIRRAVGLVANGQNLVWLPPQESEGHRWAILRALALVNPGERPLTELLERARTAIGQRSSLVIITPNITGDWLKGLIPLLWRGVIPTVLLLDPTTFDPAAVGDIQAVTRQLSDLGVAHYIITRDLLDRPEARPGHQGQWEWRVTPLGRALPSHQPGDASWKVLS